MTDTISKGYADPSHTTSEFNALNFVIESALMKVNTATLVKVVGISEVGLLTDPVGFVDITPLVARTLGDGSTQQPGVIYHCAYMRIQGGTNAIIIDPAIGDIGIAVFAQNDISAVQNTRVASNAGSRRVFSPADALYLGGVLNGAPTQYLKLAANGVTIVSPTALIINAPTLTITGNTTFTGTVTANGHRIDETHTHGGVQAGGGTSGVVT
jgi:hypothetical protein